ncbi:MAG: BACON domain-containing protein [Bacteroides sp.]|nr:BACON domain-containing protein [Bacteroides sp.]
MATACNTTEEAYYPGPESDIDISVAETGAIRLAADGKGKTINVKSNVYWDADIREDVNTNTFTVEQSTDRGNGTVTVSGALNYNNTRRDGKLYVTARNINKQIVIDVMQAQLMFSMDRHENVSMPEEGGEFSFEFTSTIEWYFRITNNTGPTEDWVKFTPGQTGYGDWEPMMMSIEVAPNYTTQERSMTLALRPVDTDATEMIGSVENGLPSSFTITQAPGTIPDAVEAVIGTPDYTECDVTINYNSTAPVSEVGIRLTEAGGSEIGTFPAEKDNGVYPDSGPVVVHLTGLTEGTRYFAEPYVTSMVATATGEAVEFFTKADAKGVSITNYEITPYGRMVKVSLSLQSDEELTEGGIIIYDMAGNEVGTYTKSLSGHSNQVEISSESVLTPVTDYRIEIFVKTAINTATEGPFDFTTTKIMPGEDDNTPIGGE